MIWSGVAWATASARSNSKQKLKYCVKTTTMFWESARGLPVLWRTAIMPPLENTKVSYICARKSSNVHHSPTSYGRKSNYQPTTRRLSPKLRHCYPIGILNKCTDVNRGTQRYTSTWRGRASRRRRCEPRKSSHCPERWSVARKRVKRRRSLRPR